MQICSKFSSFQEHTFKDNKLNATHKTNGKRKHRKMIPSA